MNNILKKYWNSMLLAKQRSPGKSMIRLVFDKIVNKIMAKYDATRSLILKDSTFINPADLYMCSLLPKKVIDQVIEDFKPASILDVGSGTGKTLEYFINNNIDAVGVENSAIAIKSSPVKDKILKHNLKRRLSLKRKFDLVWSFEVIEHIHPKFEDIFLNSLVTHGDRVIISAARPGQGGHGHFNEQEPEYWIDKFSKLGFQYNKIASEKLRNINETHAENLLVFERS